MIGYRSIGFATLAAIAIGSATGARAEVTTPTCDALVGWLQDAKLADREPVTPFGRLAISKALNGEAMIGLFGKMGRDFTAEEIKSASDIVQACVVEAQKAKDKARARTLGGLNTELVKALGPTLAAIEAGKAKLGVALDAFDADPPGRDGLRASAALRKIGEGADHKATYGTLKGINKTTWTHVQTIVATLREMPPAAWNERTMPRLEQRLPTLRAAALVEVGKELSAVPVALEGLAAIDASLSRFKTEVGESLTPDDLAELDRLATERRSRRRAPTNWHRRSPCRARPSWRSIWQRAAMQSTSNCWRKPRRRSMPCR